MNVKIGIIDADLLEKNRHRMPNLACMKISSYHKQMGDQVELLTDYSRVKEFGRVYLSKVFTETRCPEEVLTMEHVRYGGTAVSYTHLDVYKRQKEERTFRITGNPCRISSPE